MYSTSNDGSMKKVDVVNAHFYKFINMGQIPKSQSNQVQMLQTQKTKQPNFQTTWTKVGLILNPSHGIRKSKAKTWCVHDVNEKGLYYKNITRIE